MNIVKIFGINISNREILLNTENFSDFHVVRQKRANMWLRSDTKSGPKFNLMKNEQNSEIKWTYNNNNNNQNQNKDNPTMSNASFSTAFTLWGDTECQFRFLVRLIISEFDSKMTSWLAVWMSRCFFRLCCCCCLFLLQFITDTHMCTFHAHRHADRAPQTSWGNNIHGKDIWKISQPNWVWHWSQIWISACISTTKTESSFLLFLSHFVCFMSSEEKGEKKQNRTNHLAVGNIVHKYSKVIYKITQFHFDIRFWLMSTLFSLYFFLLVNVYVASSRVFVSTFSCLFVSYFKWLFWTMRWTMWNWPLKKKKKIVICIGWFNRLITVMIMMMNTVYYYYCYYLDCMSSIKFHYNA